MIIMWRHESLDILLSKYLKCVPAKELYHEVTTQSSNSFTNAYISQFSVVYNFIYSAPDRPFIY